MSKGAPAGGRCGVSAHAPPGRETRRRSALAPARPGVTFPGAWAAHTGKCPRCPGCHRRPSALRGSSPAGWAGRSPGSTHPCPPSPLALPGRRPASPAERSDLWRGSSGGSPRPRACRGAWPVSSCEGGTCSWGSPACAAGAAAPPRPRRASSGTASAPSTTFLLTQVRESYFQHPCARGGRCPCPGTGAPSVHTRTRPQPPSLIPPAGSPTPQRTQRTPPSSHPLLGSVRPSQPLPLASCKITRQPRTITSTLL